MKRLLAVLGGLLVGACAGGPDLAGVSGPRGVLPPPTAPNWKERLEQPYVFLEHHGDYRRVHHVLEGLVARAAAVGGDLAGPPFVLFFDDPARVPVPELESRACLPVHPDGASALLEAIPGLRAAVLPRALVAYAVVAGPATEVPRRYPELFGYVLENGWTPAGPVREIYLGGSALRPVPGSDQRTEVQVPWQPGGP